MQTQTAPRQGDVAAALRRIEARLSRLEDAVAPIADLGAQAPAILGTAGDVVDEWAQRLGDVDERVHALLDLVERTTRPQTLSFLRTVVEVAENAPKLVATAMDTLDEAMGEAAAQGLDLTHLADDLKRLVLASIRRAPEILALLDSGMLDQRTVRTLGVMGRAIAETSDEQPPKVGLFGAMRALGQGDLQHAMGFALGVGARIGASLQRTEKRLGA